MNKREALIISVYTGVLMVEFEELHEFIEELSGRPVFTHELPELEEQLQELVKEEFLAICSNINKKISKSPINMRTI